MQRQDQHKNQNFFHWLESEITSLSGVGAKRAEILRKVGLVKIRDLLFKLPHAYIDRRRIGSIYDYQDGDIATIKVEVLQHHKPRDKFSPHIVDVCDVGSGESFEILFFKPSPYSIDKLIIGQNRIVSGKVEIKQNRYGGMKFIIAHPDRIIRPEESQKYMRIEPQHSNVFGIPKASMFNIYKAAIDSLQRFSLAEWLPEEVMKYYELEKFDFITSLTILHNPANSTTYADLDRARKRLAYDEILAYMIKLKLLRRERKSYSVPKLQFSGKLKLEMLRQLPFSLTEAQNRVLAEIERDLASDRRMTRIIQGDVGCGKTLVALASALDVVEAGGQVAIMAPTEILARQHYLTINKICEPLGIQCTLLISALKTAEKRDAIAETGSGQGKIIIGTHALFQDAVAFSNLRLVVIDEQHKFGVKQRMSLLNKAHHNNDSKKEEEGQSQSIAKARAHFMMMTATPIPRTQAMMQYGDLDMSIIDQKPANRKDIHTSIISMDRALEVEEHLSEIIKKSEKIYWVCPLIEESEALNLAHAKRRCEILQKLYGNCVGLLHGRMSADEKQEVMEQLINGQIMILVSTVVIEVGVDVRDATLIVIENAERFGISQLHQLRGRVGRSELASHCILLYKKPISQVTRERLTALKQSNDGFWLAQKDLELRGQGDYLGSKQSGDVNFQIYSTDDDSDLMSSANKISAQLVSSELIKQDDGDTINLRSSRYGALLQIFQ